MHSRWALDSQIVRYVQDLVLCHCARTCVLNGNMFFMLSAMKLNILRYFSSSFLKVFFLFDYVRRSAHHI
jgi:hypothetical protein